VTGAEKHAYRASDEFTAALKARNEENMRFFREVIEPWDDAHPDTRSLWARNSFSLERRCVGFSDPGGTAPPEGLSRNREREELLPKRGKAGEPWRKALAALNRNPSIGPVFTAYGVDPLVWEGHRICTPGMIEAPDGLFVTWSAPHPEPGEHLEKVALSEYYAAVERAERERAS
jgi:hypothetical protein